MQTYTYIYISICGIVRAAHYEEKDVRGQSTLYWYKMKCAEKLLISPSQFSNSISFARTDRYLFL